MTVENESEDAPGDIEQRVIQTLLDLREERGWSQSEVARRMVERGWQKYTQMTVSRTEKGERPIRLNEAQALADLFGVELFTLWLPKSVRAYDAALKQSETLAQELYGLTRKYLAAQSNLAGSAEAAGLAESEMSYVAAQLMLTPERLAQQARMAKQSEEDAVKARIKHPPNEREAALESKFWDAKEPKLRDLYEGLYGEHPEEA